MNRQTNVRRINSAREEEEVVHPHGNSAQIAVLPSSITAKSLLCSAQTLDRKCTTPFPNTYSAISIALLVPSKQRTMSLQGELQWHLISISVDKIHSARIQGVRSDSRCRSKPAQLCRYCLIPNTVSCTLMTLTTYSYPGLDHRAAYGIRSVKTAGPPFIISRAGCGYSCAGSRGGVYGGGRGGGELSGRMGGGGKIGGEVELLFGFWCLGE